MFHLRAIASLVGVETIECNDKIDLICEEGMDVDIQIKNNCI